MFKYPTQGGAKGRDRVLYWLKTHPGPSVALGVPGLRYIFTTFPAVNGLLYFCHFF